MANGQAQDVDDVLKSALTWLAAGLATGVVLAVVAIDREVASRRLAVRAAAARVAPAFVTVSSALH